MIVEIVHRTDVSMEELVELSVTLTPNDGINGCVLIVEVELPKDIGRLDAAAGERRLDMVTEALVEDV